MFGKIKKINNNEIVIENLTGKSIPSIVNCHVVFLEENRKIIGEIIYIDEIEAKILLVGEIINDSFHAGLIRKPSGNAEVKVINGSELELMYGKNSLDKENLYLGKSAVYQNFNISVPLNNFFPCTMP